MWNLQIVLFETSFLWSAEPVTLGPRVINEHAVISLPVISKLIHNEPLLQISEMNENELY